MRFALQARRQFNSLGIFRNGKELVYFLVFVGVELQIFFRLVSLPVVVNFFVGASGHAMTPAATIVLTDEDNAIFFALVNRAAWTRRHACRIQTVIAISRQVLHENISEVKRDFLPEFF